MDNYYDDIREEQIAQFEEVKRAKAQVRVVQALVAEFLGTMILTMAICLSPDDTYLAAGLTLMVIVYAFDHICGAHYNPTVSLSMLAAGRMTAVMCFLYILVQVLGGTVGALLSYAVAGASNISEFQPNPKLSHPNISAVFVEGLFAFSLSLVVQQVSHQNQLEPNSYTGIAIGSSLLAGVSAAGGISGGCFNSAVGTGRDLAALFNGGSMGDVWVYWVGPPIGGILSGVLSSWLMFMYQKEQEESKALELRQAEAEAQGGTVPQDEGDRRLSLRVPLVEMIGAFFITLVAALGGHPLAVGAMVTAMVHMGDHMCGGDYNPAVSFGLLTRFGYIADAWKTAIVSLAQVVGAVLAGFAALVLQGDVKFGGPEGSHGPAGAGVFEFLWTAMLVYTVWACTTQIMDVWETPGQRQGHQASYHGLAIGMVYAIGRYMAGPNGAGSGGYFNPAMATGVASAALANGEKSGRWMWVYWIAELAGSVLGGAIFALLHAHTDVDGMTEPPVVPGAAGPEGGLDPQQLMFANAHADSDLEEAGSALAPNRNYGDGGRFASGGTSNGGGVGYEPPYALSAESSGRDFSVGSGSVTSRGGGGGVVVGGGGAGSARRVSKPTLVSEDEGDRSLRFARGR